MESKLFHGAGRPRYICSPGVASSCQPWIPLVHVQPSRGKRGRSSSGTGGGPSPAKPAPTGMAAARGARLGALICVPRGSKREGEGGRGETEGREGSGWVAAHIQPNRALYRLSKNPVAWPAVSPARPSTSPTETGDWASTPVWAWATALSMPASAEAPSSPAEAHRLALAAVVGTAGMGTCIGRGSAGTAGRGGRDGV